jgi:hypothetical protein
MFLSEWVASTPESPERLNAQERVALFQQSNREDYLSCASENLKSENGSNLGNQAHIEAV